MKKMAFLIISIFVVTNILQAGVLAGGSFGIFRFSDDRFKNTVGSNLLQYGFDIGYELKRFQLLLGGRYLSKNGSATHFKEKITFSMFPLNLTCRYLVIQKKIQPYVGLGISQCFYKEECDSSYFDPISNTALGFFAEAGSYFGLSNKIFANLLMRYMLMNDSPKNVDVNMGGLSIDVALLYKF